MLRAADEPHILRPGGGAGLAKQRQIEWIKHRRGAPADRAAQHVHHLKRGARIHRLLTLDTDARHWLAIPFGHAASSAITGIGAQQHFATAILHIINHRRRIQPSVIGKRAVSADHLHQRRFACAQRGGGIGRELANPELFDLLDNIRHSRSHADLHGHDILRLFKPVSHRVLSAAAASAANALLAQVCALIVAEARIIDLG